MSWTDERVEKLKELWAEGMSASQIAKALGGVTRNAVIGKVHRLGLSNRGTGAPAGTGPAEEADAKVQPKPTTPVRPQASLGVAPQPSAPTPPVQETSTVRPAAQQPVAPLPPVARHGSNGLRDPGQPRPPGLPTQDEEEARATLVEIEKIARNLTLMELTERTCKWPIGDPTDENFRFCGLNCVPGKPYCQYHVAVAFQPMSTRRDRARASR
ncbi:MAG: GcrA family cell cycle regulator [Pseudomonadota bacterium]